MRQLRYLFSTMVLISASTSGQEILLDSFHTTGTRATGMGGAYLSLSNDASGLSYNPAGLAGISRPEISSSFLRSIHRNESEFFGSHAVDDVTSTRIGGGGLVYPFPVYRGGLVLGAGYSRRATFDQGIRIDGYDAYAQFQKDGFSRDRGALGEFSFGGAVEVLQSVSVGIAGFVWEGDNRFEQSLTLLDTRDVHPDTVQMFTRFESNDTYEAKGIRLGLNVVDRSGVRFGFTARPPVEVKVRSRLQDEYIDEFEDGIEVFPPERFTDAYSYTLPWEFGAGLSWERSGFIFAADAVYSDLRAASYERGPVNVAANVDDFDTQYREDIRLHLGTEYKLPGQPLFVRAGYFWNPINFIGGEELPDVTVWEEHQGITFGASAEMQKTLSLDVAVVLNQHSQREGRRDDNVRTKQWFASVSYRLPR
jgi:hypothetical protein